MHRLKLTLAVLALLSACAAPKAPPPAASLRTAGQPMYSTASFDAGRLQGAWVQTADVTEGQAVCAPGRMTVSGDQITWALCLNGVARTGQGKLQAAGPGRFVFPGLAQPVWVLWADADDRTLVLGTPSGAFGAVLDRGAMPADRAKAARDILVWNGYAAGMIHRY